MTTIDKAMGHLTAPPPDDNDATDLESYVPQMSPIPEREPSELNYTPVEVKNPVRNFLRTIEGFESDFNALDFDIDVGTQKIMKALEELDQTLQASSSLTLKTSYCSEILGVLRGSSSDSMQDVLDRYLSKLMTESSAPSAGSMSV